MADGTPRQGRGWAADRSRVDPALGRTALVSMPFGSALQPSMALGQLQAQLIDAGQNAFSLYLNVEFAAQFGLAAYEMIAKRRGVDVQLGEWLFAAEAWDSPAAMDEAAFLEVAETEAEALRDYIGDPIPSILRTRRRHVPRFLDLAARSLAEIDDLRVVGFSCLFFQTLPSIALARRLRALRPDVKLVFGGPSMHDEMGREYMRALPFLDAMSVGEADRDAPALFRALALGEPPSDLGDVLWREAPGGEVREGAPARPADGPLLDALPAPDYENYFRAMQRAGFLQDPHVNKRVFVPYETSRGCWWGQKRHCTFCGLNPLGMSYRAKSPERALELISETVERWGVPRLLAVDNILPQNYYDDVLPALRDGPYGGKLEIWYEIKTNVAREKIKLLGEAGVTMIVPGIESLSSNILRCIDKGVTALHNVYALKLFAEYGIMPGWGMLIRIPGERAEDYAAMTALAPRLMHLHPPFSGPRPVELHRFSPYHFRAEAYVDGYRPQGWYRGLFPEGEVDLEKVAYYFDAEWKDVVEERHRAPLVAAVWAWIDAWRERPRTPKLEWRPLEGGGLAILDTRGERPAEWRLDRREAAFLRLMEDPLPAARLAAAAADLGFADADASALREELTGAGLVLELDSKLLSLVLPAAAPEPSLAYRRGVFSRVGQREQLEAAMAEAPRNPAAPVPA
ncbi:MAG: RiPP maturation radical SAM C-methyltransferase [Pseudomonadota bacterium]